MNAPQMVADADLRRGVPSIGASGFGFIRDLCVALFHRWKPGCIFVILTAYLDESGTHGGDGTAENPASPTTVMAGMMGTANQWKRFESDFERIRHHYSFKIFHALDFWSNRGEFHGWSAEKRRDCLLICVL